MIAKKEGVDPGLFLFAFTEHGVLILIEYQDEENMEAVNDLSEDMRQELNNLYNAIAALSAQIQSPSQLPGRRIGLILPGQD